MKGRSALWLGLLAAATASAQGDFPFGEIPGLNKEPSVQIDLNPEMMKLFERLKDAIDTAEELRVLDAIYEAMPRRNFSSHLLQCVPGQLAVMEMRDIFWSDWGDPRRVADTLETIGKQPAFAEERLPFLYQG